MKKHLLAILVCISSMTIGNGQTNVYHAFPDSVIWRADYNLYQPFQLPCIKNYYLEYFSKGDTTINSSVCRKLFVAVVVDSVIGTCSPDFLPTPGYVGALKEDPTANKAFIVFPNSTTDSLLYDYNLVVGDTIKGIISQSNSNLTGVVLSVDSLLINNQYHKRWNFGQDYDGNPTFIIEGIGSNSGLLEPLYPFSLDYTDRYLICVKDSLQTYFSSNHNSPVGCNPIYTGAAELNLVNNFLILPNPFSNEATLRTDRDLKNATVTITNIYGQEVKQIKNINGKELKINRGNLSGGIYFLQLTQENKIIFTCKLIIYA